MLKQLTGIVKFLQARSSLELRIRSQWMDQWSKLRLLLLLLLLLMLLLKSW